ncbi:hypothetical protein QL285_068578 [Trifolium repens]|nr:hypothetical protein QL285_068578 [Trifolium repens]
MAFSWMIQLLKVYMKSDFHRVKIEIVIPKTHIPMWFNKQNVGSSISIEPLPNMDDKNLIGVACCATFVAHDDPTSLGTKSKPHIMMGFQTKRFGCSYIIPRIHLGKDLVTVDVDHLLLTFLSKELFISSTRTLKRELMHDISGIELVAVVEQPLGLHFEVKNCGYQWIFEEDLEQLNPQMMYTGNSSVQPYY